MNSSGTKAISSLALALPHQLNHSADDDAIRKIYLNSGNPLPNKFPETVPRMYLMTIATTKAIAKSITPLNKADTFQKVAM